MKQTLNYSRFKFATLLFTFVVIFASCDNNEDLSDIDSVSMKTLPQVKYILGDALNLADMVITIDKGGNIEDIPYSSFESENITTEPENGKILELSDESVIVKIGDMGNGLLQAINVTNDAVAEIKNEPTVDYVDGQRLDLTNLVVTLSYENGDVVDIAYPDFGDDFITTPKHGDALNMDSSELLITYVPEEIDMEEELNMYDFSPQSGVLLTDPLKSVYAVGDVLELSGAVIRYTLYDFGGPISTVDAVAEDFALFGLTVTPGEGETLEATDTKVNVIHPLYGASVDIPITVN